MDGQQSSVLEMLANRYRDGRLSRMQCRKQTECHSSWFSV